MSALLFQMANSMMNFMNSSTLLRPGEDEIYDDESNWGWVGQIVDAIDAILYPILILVGAAGTIYAVYLGVNLARADSADRQQEAKKRLINAIIGLAVIIALILLLKLFCNYVYDWIPSIAPTTSGNNG